MFNFYPSKFHVAPYSCRPKKDVVFEDKVVNNSVQTSRLQPSFVRTQPKTLSPLSRHDNDCNIGDFTTQPQTTECPVEQYWHNGSNWTNDSAQRSISVENEAPTGTQQHLDPAWNLSFCSGRILFLEISRIFARCLVRAHKKDVVALRPWRRLQFRHYSS